MPIYEYHCDDCGTDFEKLLRRSSESEDLRCPSCGEKRLTIRLSTFAAHSGHSKAPSSAPMCPSGGVCPTPGMCGRN